MTPEQMDSMTLADLEAMAKRFGAAVATIREAQALLGGSKHDIAKTQMLGVAIDDGPIQRGPPPPQLNPGEVAERERLMRQFKHDGLPDAIKAAEEQQ